MRASTWTLYIDSLYGRDNMIVLKLTGHEYGCILNDLEGAVKKIAEWDKTETNLQTLTNRKALRDKIKEQASRCR